MIELRKMCYCFGGSSVTGANEMIRVTVSRIISYALFVNKVSCQLRYFSRVYICICMTQGNAKIFLFTACFGHFYNLLANTLMHK
jgi:hypothetical protein